MSSLESIDDRIRRDMAALADATAASDDDFEAVRAQLVGSDSPYRDGRLGIERRRQSALEDRRIELALMPLRLARVFVHRVARIAAAGVAVACALVAWVSVADPFLLRMFELFLPRLDVDSALATGTAGIAGAYILGVFGGEWLLERAARRSVSASRDPLADIARTGPVYEARRLAERVDIAAAALPLLAVALAAPLGAFLSALTFARIPGAYTDVLYLGDAPGLVDRNLIYLAGGAVVGIVSAIAVGLGCARERRGLRSRSNDVLSHGGALLGWVAFGGFVALVGAWTMALRLSHSQVAPAPWMRWTLVLAGSLAVAGVAAWTVLRLRRREWRAIE